VQQIHTNTLLRLCALVVVCLLFGAEHAGLAQNSNSSTTEPAAQETNENANTPTTPPRRRGRGRRGRRRAAAAAPTDTTGAEATGAEAMGTPASGAGGQTGSTLGRVGDAASLDGTYTGTIDYPDGGLTGDATLTITGNSFNLESGGNTQTGTLVTQSWPGYTAVSMRFGTETPAKIISLRAWHHGTSLRLQSVPGESHAFSFRTAGGGGGATGGRRHRRGRRHASPPPPPTEEPATPPPSM
jgi:hypothetical protein